MPVVFSPGEPETRPLDPDAIVYTTGDKVAQLLGIAAGEPVLGAANAASTGFYITGTDLREHGFESGDKILVYSDLDPLGTEFTITAPSVEDVSGTKYVKLPTTVSTPANYTTAVNTEIQNLTIFTNGKSRGVTKNIVNDHIRRIQDRIDNMTHNAWRPYLVSAEYINFDTYKPYRRRYYTDYVGTAPLLFRNVQQILRIELWQGDDYREIGSAEARIKFSDVSSLSGKSIYLGLGNGSVASLPVGSGSGNWRGEIDANSTAQNFADLINKEDRVSKSAVEFSPAFTLEGSTSNVAVHNEFLASANSDYGTGVVKLTSMRAVKAGEECSIVTDSTDINIDQVQTNTATVTSVVSTTVNVNSTTGFVKAGLCIKGDTVFRYTGKTATSFTGCVVVTGSSLSDISGTITQNTFVTDLQGGSASGDNARLRDWWLDHEMGIIYFNNSYPFFEWNAIKVAYIYGERYLEKAIEEAATKLVASELLMADDRSVLIPEGTQNIDLGSKAQLWRREALDIIARYKEVVVFS
jgi:hypothetical protein|tara:strand:+ start:131 stop:1702 length:1572 start_codon:yes stop_codon:yes gene_type:complete